MNQNSQRTPPRHLTRTMNSECFFCPIGGCSHSPASNNSPFTTRTTLLRHLNSSTHASTHHLANHAICANAGIYTCCHCSCPVKPNIFFSSCRAYNDYCTTAHHPPPPPTTAHTKTPSTPFAITTQFLHLSSIMPTTSNHWLHGLAFISMMYSHKPPNFRTTWRHFFQSCNKSAFCNLQAAIIQAIVTTSTNGTNIDDIAPFWWLLLHLDMLIFAPLTQKQRNNYSIQETIRGRINAAFSGGIA
jgi:hypothetical protein